MAEDNRQEDDNGLSKVIKSMRQDREAEARRDIGNRKIADRTLEEQARTSQLLEYMLEGMNLDRQRAQDDKESGPEKKEDPKTDNKKDDKQSLGFLGVLGRILAGLSGAVLGLAYGIISTLTRPFRRVLKGLGDVIKKSGLVQGIKAKMVSIVGSIKNIFSTAAKAVTNFFSKLNPVRAFKAGFGGETNKAIRGAMGRFISLQKGITGFSAWMGRLSADLVKRFKRIQRVLGTIPRVMRGVSVQTGKVGKFFKKLGDGMKTVGKFFQGFAKTFGFFFTRFATIGRIIAWPITVLTSIIGGIMQSFKDFTKAREEGDGIIKSLFKGFMGFFKGLINTLVMWPLDMLKGAVGWILGKLGLEGAENALAGFSFKGLFSSIWDYLINFVAGIPGWILDKIKGIGNFLSNIDFGGFFGSVGDKVGEWWNGASEGFFKKFEHAKDTFGKLKGKVAGMQDKFRQFIMDKLPEKGSFLEKFVPDAVYEWVGQTGRYAPPKKDDAVDAPEKEVEEEVEITEGQRKMAEKLGLKVPEQASTESTQQEPVPVEVKVNQELNEARMESIKTGDKQPLMEKKLEVASLEDKVPDRPFTQDEIDSELDQATKDWMLWFNSPEGIEHQKKMQIEKDEREKQFQIQMAEAKMRREEEHAKMMERTMLLRAERAEKAREMLATGMYKGQQITDEQRRRAELYIEREEQTKAGAMVVAPQTNVTNNTSPTAVVADMNMPVVDNLDRTYGT